MEVKEVCLINRNHTLVEQIFLNAGICIPVINLNNELPVKEKAVLGNWLIRKSGKAMESLRYSGFQTGKIKYTGQRRGNVNTG